MEIQVRAMGAPAFNPDEQVTSFEHPDEYDATITVAFDDGRVFVVEVDPDEGVVVRS